mmetsp:Transcript_5625/g.34900  ORF Transcript_5625/g.34900 Transcript_5625/m.34900 type:complete len:108 (-) Transcript_5625:1165-1488(-)
MYQRYREEEIQHGTRRLFSKIWQLQESGIICTSKYSDSIGSDLIQKWDSVQLHSWNFCNVVLFTESGGWEQGPLIYPSRGFQQIRESHCFFVASLKHEIVYVQEETA